jgi:general secretion pathway protein B
MSYILDALKKAEKERQRNATRDLLAGSETFAPLSSKRLIWPYLLVFALLLNAGLFAWLLGPWTAKGPQHVLPSDRKSTSSGMSRGIIPPVPANAPRPADAESELVRREGKEPAESPPDLKERSQADASPREVMTGHQAPQRASSPEEAPPAKRKEVRPPASIGLQPPAVEQNSPPQIKAAHLSAGGGNKVYRMNELPQSVLQELPHLSLSLHLYNADPSSRLINVKGKTLREGQELSAGLKLEEIRPDGAVFSFQNYRFEVGINAR